MTQAVAVTQLGPRNEIGLPYWPLRARQVSHSEVNLKKAIVPRWWRDLSLYVTDGPMSGYLLTYKKGLTSSIIAKNNSKSIDLDQTVGFNGDDQHWTQSVGMTKTSRVAFNIVKGQKAGIRFLIYMGISPGGRSCTNKFTHDLVMILYGSRRSRFKA